MIYSDKIELILTYKHDPEDNEIFTERVDAVKIGDYYKLAHVPAFAPNIAYGDIVKVEYDKGEFYFDELVEESGYSVVKIVIWEPECKERIISTLDNYECGVNTHLAENYLVISIPPDLLYSPVRAFLSTEKALKNIDFGECLSKIHTVQV